jgi:3-carboxy-cis,cis-muconate cycloisomerase
MIPLDLGPLGFSTPDMDEVFSVESFVGGMVEFERALALALADTGIAPVPEARAVATACEELVPDPMGVLAGTWDVGTPVIPLLDVIRGRIEGEARRWLHHGATTQDVVDTALMLVSGRGLDVLDQTMATTARHLRTLVETHRHQPHRGRTFLQHATATTFGMRAASWLGDCLEHVATLRASRLALPVQLGGPLGDLGAYGPEGLAVMAALAARLGLAAPALPWHTDRTVVRRLVGTVQDAVASNAKIAVDVALLAQSDTAEVAVRAGGSSSVPGKRNPIDAIRVLAAADVCHGAAGIIGAARPHELDRALGAWHAEWAALPLVFRTAAAAFDATASMAATLEARTDEMVRNVGDVTVPELDPRLIDGVLTRFADLIGPS